jgi:hypothetical protein
VHIYHFNPNGPNGKPVCIRCQNNTEGRLCDVCQNGFFRLKSGGKTAYEVRYGHLKILESK